MSRRTTIFTSLKLSPATIAAQQKLSNKFGIATFSRKGTISTVPTIQSGGFSDINTGIGGFSNFDSFAQAAIKKQFEIEQKARIKNTGITVNTKGQTVPSTNKLDDIIVSDPRQPIRNIEIKPNTNNSKGLLDGFSADSLKKYALPVGLGFVVLMIIKGGKRR